jgi:hypothetical protein
VIALKFKDTTETSIQALLNDYIDVEPKIDVLVGCGTTYEPLDGSDPQLIALKQAVSAIEKTKPKYNPSDTKNTVAPEEIQTISKQYENALMAKASNVNAIKTTMQQMKSLGQFNWANYLLTKIDNEMELLTYKVSRGYVGMQKSQKHTLIPKKYVIFYTDRKSTTQANPLAKNETPVDVTPTITINGSNFRIKGCIFHTGSGGGGHYVYGVYDKAGSPAYVVNDIPTYKINFEDVFGQRNGWLSIMYLYVRM